MIFSKCETRTLCIFSPFSLPAESTDVISPTPLTDLALAVTELPAGAEPRGVKYGREYGFCADTRLARRERGGEQEKALIGAGGID